MVHILASGGVIIFLRFLSAPVLMNLFCTVINPNLAFAFGIGFCFSSNYQIRLGVVIDNILRTNYNWFLHFKTKTITILRAYSHHAKVAAKVEKIKEQAKMNIYGKHQR